MIEDTKKELTGLFNYLWDFMKNPVQEIKNIPNIHWTSLVSFQFCLSLISVVISNLLAPFAITFLNVIVSLASAIVATGLSSLFFYYFFLIIYEKQLSFLKIFTLVLFAHIPFALFHLAVYFFPPADLIGIGISALLMIVGLVENFKIPKKVAINIMIGLYSIFFIYWAIHLYTIQKQNDFSVPQDLDQIEKEVDSLFEH